MGKMKTWREASRANSIRGVLSPRQWRAAVRDWANKNPSNLLRGLLARV